MSSNILFVCTGNMCRSPMAEYMLRSRLPLGSKWQVSSAGTMTGDGMDASANAVEVLHEIGIDMSGHRTRALTEEMIGKATVIIAMSQEHVEDVVSIDLGAKEKIFLVRSFDEHADTRDVPDPVGWDIDVYRGTREMIDGALPGLLEFIEELEGRQGI